MKRLLLLTCLATIAAAACDDEPVTPDGLTVVSATVTPDSAVGTSDSVTLVVTTLNSSDRTIEFPAGRPFAFDMIVSVPGQGITWRLMDGAFGSPATPFSIAPGQSDTWTAVWPLVDSQGNRVAAGTYSVVGVIGQDLNAPILETNVLTVRVE